MTLKIRTGWDRQNRNAVRIAHIAEDAGIAALSVHGRTRECGFVGAVEYDTIRAVKQAVGVPVTANGDVDSPEMAREVLEHTGADAVMIGRAAQGRPWIFREIRHFLDYGEKLPSPAIAEIRQLILEHLADHHAFHGEEAACASRASIWAGIPRIWKADLSFGTRSTRSTMHRRRSRQSTVFSTS